jgi:hypothetical protein
MAVEVDKLLVSLEVRIGPYMRDMQCQSASREAQLPLQLKASSD